MWALLAANCNGVLLPFKCILHELFSGGRCQRLLSDSTMDVMQQHVTSGLPRSLPMYLSCGFRAYHRGRLRCRVSVAGSDSVTYRLHRSCMSFLGVDLLVDASWLLNGCNAATCCLQSFQIFSDVSFLWLSSLTSSTLIDLMQALHAAIVYCIKQAMASMACPA